MKTRFFLSFAEELMKIASGIPNDAAVRQLLAERQGEEFLPGGEITSNEPASADLQKVAISSIVATQLGAGSPISKNVSSKGPEKYQEGRDWAVTGLKGATGGVGATGLFHSLRNAEHKLTTRQVRRGAAVGTTIALGDRLLRHREAKKNKEREKTAGIVSPSPERVVKSPSGILRAAQQTGSVRANKPKMVGKVFNGPVRLGTHKFQMPTRLGVR